MNPYDLAIAGQAIDILGSYFLSVEVIGLDKLRILRDRHLRGLQGLLNPEMVLVDERGNQLDWTTRQIIKRATPEERAEAIGHRGHSRISNLLLSISLFAIPLFLGVALIWAIIEVFDHFGINAMHGVVIQARETPLPLVVIASVILLPFTLCLIIVLGSLIYRAFVSGVELGIYFLEFTERRDADGSIGVIGFLLIILGFALQLWSNVLQRNSQ